MALLAGSGIASASSGGPDTFLTGDDLKQYDKARAALSAKMAKIKSQSKATYVCGALCGGFDSMSRLHATFVVTTGEDQDAATKGLSAECDKVRAPEIRNLFNNTGLQHPTVFYYVDRMPDQLREMWSYDVALHTPYSTDVCQPTDAGAKKLEKAAVAAVPAMAPEPQKPTPMAGEDSVENQVVCLANDAYDAREADQHRFKEVQDLYHRVKSNSALPLDGSGAADPSHLDPLGNRLDLWLAAHHDEVARGLATADSASLYGEIEEALERFSSRADSADNHFNSGEKKECASDAAELASQSTRLTSLLNEASGSPRAVFLAYWAKLKELVPEGPETPISTAYSLAFCGGNGRWNEGKAARGAREMVDGIRGHLYALLSEAYSVLLSRAELVAEGPRICAPGGEKLAAKLRNRKVSGRNSLKPDLDTPGESAPGSGQAQGAH